MAASALPALPLSLPTVWDPKRKVELCHNSNKRDDNPIYRRRRLPVAIYASCPLICLLSIAPVLVFLQLNLTEY